MRFFDRATHVFGQTEVADAVDDAEIDRFCVTAHLGRHLVFRHTEDLSRRRGMDVLTVAERRDQAFVARKIGKQTQFDLRIIGGNQDIAIAGDESRANFASFRLSDGDILQIWLGRRQSARCGKRLIEDGVDAPFGIDHRLHRDQIGRKQL